MNVQRTRRWLRNKEHWEETLDALNLRREGDAAQVERDLALFDTADIRQALDFLGPLDDRTVLDVGGGLGLMAVLLARRGARVIVADVSLPRLRLARQTAASLGLADRIAFVVSSAEELPFLAQTLDRQTSKSVLIHTELAEAARELARTLRPGGRAVFIEPLNRNPFVSAYRRLAAPGIWKEITRYFDDASVATLTAPFAESGFRTASRGLYFTAFLATLFNYFLHLPFVYRIAEAVLLAFDSMLFALLPALKRRCWFVLVEVEGKGTHRDG